MDLRLLMMETIDLDELMIVLYVPDSRYGIPVVNESSA
jgi:hypothetical protein